MLRTNTLIAASVAAVLAAPAAHATNGYFSHGYGTKSKGLAGAGVAFSQDAMAAATNPAGMVWQGDRLDVGAAAFSPLREFEGSDVPNLPPAPQLGPFGGTPAPGFPVEPGTTESDSNFFLIPHFAYNKALDEQSSVGVTVYGNGGMNTDYGEDPIDPNRALAIDRFAALSDPTNPLAGTPGAMFAYDGAGVCGQNGGGVYCAGSSGINLSQLFVNLSYSRKISDRASWGASLVLAGQGFKARGLAFFGGFTESAALGQQPKDLSDNGTDLSFGAGVKLGVQGEVMDGLTLGASYQSKIWMSDFDDYADLFADGGNFDIPPTATIGLAWEVMPGHTLVADYQYIWYEDVDSVSNPNLLGQFCSPQAFAAGTFDPSYCLGGKNGAGFGWENMGIIKVGWQYEYNPDLTFRVGYSHNSQPIPSSEALFNTLAPAVVEDHITAGLTQRLGKHNEWSLAFTYVPEHTISGPNAFTGDPGFGIPSQEIDITMEQFEVEASFGMTWE